MRTIAIINQKGGCGKTTTSINLAAVMALRGQRTLLLDMDPQSHCALGLAVPDNQIQRSTADLLRHGPSGGLRVQDVTWQISRGLDLVPSSMALAGIEQQLATAPDKDRRLAQVLHTVRDDYDFCIIDCPPSIGLLTFNALRAADEVMIPVETGYFAMQGSVRQEQTIEMMARRVGHDVRFSVLPTMYDVRTKLAREILGELKKHFGERVLPIVINFNSKLKEAASFGQPITEYDSASRGMQDFDALATWLLDNPPAAPRTEATATQALPADAPPTRTLAAAAPAAAPQRTAPAPAPALPATAAPVMSRAAELAGRARALASRNSELNHKIRHDQDQAAHRPLPPVPAPVMVSPPVSGHPTARPEAAPLSPAVSAAALPSAAPPAPAAEPTLKEKLAALYGVRMTTRGVLFVQPDGAETGALAIAGDFNNWNPSQTPMTRDEKLGVWRACVVVPAGRYRYRLVRDGQWVQDPFNPTVESNPFGELNNLIEVSATASSPAVVTPPPAYRNRPPPRGDRRRGRRRLTRRHPPAPHDERNPRRQRVAARAPPMDHHSDSTLDELAGLFLTEPADPLPSAASDAPPPREDPLGGPAPIKLSPKLTPGVAGAPATPASFGPSLGNEPDEHLLELLTGAVPVDAGSAEEPEPARDESSPSLRWTGHDEVDLTNPPRRPEPARARAEAVLLGNLPGMAGPWLTQYAQLLAQHGGGRRSVAVLHLDGDRVDLELIEPTVRRDDDDPAARAPGLRVPPGGFGDRDLVDLLDQLCRTGPAPVGTVLLHADPRRERAERLIDLADWTLVSGADDAALAAAGRLVRGLLDQDPRVAAVRLGLMVAGSDADTSQHAADRLRRDLGGRLDTAPQLVGYQQQMIPARCRILGSFDGIDAQWPRLTAWLSALQPPAGSIAAPAAEAAPTPAHEPAAARPTLPPLDAPVEVPARGHDAAAPEADRFAEAGIDAGFHAAPDLFALIDTDARTTASIPGGVALEARCPSAPDAQLALDAAGRLHLLLRHDSDTGDLPTPREAIVELVAVRTWARQHRQLLQLTERSRRFDPDADPVLHLFTDRADLSVELVSRLGGLLKLHLLRDVAVGSEHTWFCVPLSA